MCLMVIDQKLLLAHETLLLMKYIIRENNFHIMNIWHHAHIQTDFRFCTYSREGIEKVNEEYEFCVRRSALFLKYTPSDNIF